MAANIVDIEFAMLEAAATSDAGGAIFFDFAAAFPSVEQPLLHSMFASLGWPRWLRNFVGCLYHRNRCYIMLGGSRYEGFVVTRGVRQGCPLSPLLFAVASDLLLRRLARCVPGAVRRAYADDLALVHGNVFEHTAVLCSTFMEYERISLLNATPIPD